MKSLSAAIIVAAGVVQLSSSQFCAVSIMALKPIQSIEIARHGWGIGVFLIIAGMLGWAYSLWSRADSSCGSDQKT